MHAQQWESAAVQTGFISSNQQPPAMLFSTQCKHFVHMYVAGTTGVLCWKS